MSWDPILALKDELAAIAVADEQGWLEYLPLAARLAALGEPEPLQRWPKLAAPLKDRVEPLLIERSEEGIWDLQQSLGKDIGLALIDAQDFHCFRRREHRILPPAANHMLAAWIEEAERTALDEEAAAMLRKFLRRFPLPAADRLAIVDTPMPLAEEAILAAMAKPCPTTEVEWPAPTIERTRADSPVPSLANLAQYDAGSPSDRLKRRFERLDVPVEIPRIGRLAVSRRIDDAWRVVIDVERDDRTAPEVDLVRLGTIPGSPATDAPGRWLVDLRPWDHMQRKRFMENAPLVIGFSNGHRLRLK